MTEGKSVSTPLPSFMKLSKEDSPKSNFEKAEMAKVPYSLAVGSLMWAMIAIRPDIAFVVGVGSRYMANPDKKHWLAVKNIFRYLKVIANKCLQFGDNNLAIVGYSDSNYGGCVDNRSLTLGYIFLFS